VVAKTLTVEAHGLPALHAKLRDGRLFKPTSDFLGDLGRTGQKTAQRASKPHPADKGTLGRFVLLDIDKDKARVHMAGSIANVAFTIEEGRRPGRRPPYTPIKKWAIAHGIIPDAKGNSAAVKELREDIKNRGTQGIHFMLQAQETVDKALHTGIPKTEHEIKKIWDRP